jgi:hypothetical protein
MKNTSIETPESSESAPCLGETLFGQILEFFGDDSKEITSDERRIRQRYPIACKMHLMPISAGGAPVKDGILMIFGKDLSQTGICFSHDFHLPHRRMLISLVDPQMGQFVVEAEVVWTRPTLIGLHESGCRLIRKVSGGKLNSQT